MLSGSHEGWPCAIGELCGDPHIAVTPNEGRTDCVCNDTANPMKCRQPTPILHNVYGVPKAVVTANMLDNSKGQRRPSGSTEPKQPFTRPIWNTKRDQLLGTFRVFKVPDATHDLLICKGRVPPCTAVQERYSLAVVKGCCLQYSAEGGIEMISSPLGEQRPSVSGGASMPLIGGAGNRRSQCGRGGRGGSRDGGSRGDSRGGGGRGGSRDCGGRGGSRGGCAPGIGKRGGRSRGGASGVRLTPAANDGFSLPQDGITNPNGLFADLSDLTSHDPRCTTLGETTRRADADQAGQAMSATTQDTICVGGVVSKGLQKQAGAYLKIKDGDPAAAVLIARGISSCGGPRQPAFQNRSNGKAKRGAAMAEAAGQLTASGSRQPANPGAAGGAGVAPPGPLLRIGFDDVWSTTMQLDAEEEAEERAEEGAEQDAEHDAGRDTEHDAEQNALATTIERHWRAEEVSVWHGEWLGDAVAEEQDEEMDALAGAEAGQLAFLESSDWEMVLAPYTGSIAQDPESSTHAVQE